MTPALYRVGPPGLGAYPTLGAAIARAEATVGPALFLLAPGLYREKIFVDRPDWRFEGTGPGPEDVVLVWNDYARKTGVDGRPMRTFNTATLFVGGDGFSAENLTVANDSGPGDLVGQAVAAYVDADRAVFRRCRFLGRQDTLFTGPLPPFPKEGTDFGGPRDTGPGRLSAKAPGSPAVGHQLYEDCYFEGDVDFLFGSAEAVFRRCEVRSLNLGKACNGWICAASTPEGPSPGGPDPFLGAEDRALLEALGRSLGRDLGVHGHLFLGCRLTSAPGVAPGSVSLGRPWREGARTLFLNCEMGPHIHPEGWDDWGKAEARTRSLYLEAGSSGPGAGQKGLRASWSILSSWK